MATFKCKICGGDLEVVAGQSVCECMYCGTKQTLPKLDSEEKTNLYARADHFRRNNDFDKAMGIYEKILEMDNSDAEAYWSLVLCTYGIEYVEDPSTHKRVPTVNRVQFGSVLANENYKKAMELADYSQREIYQADARTIDEIQKGLLQIAQNEEPFDVFICYKETDARGQRTQDSVLANDLYYQLTNEGFRVFFARITLEDKLGTAYEPYIFAALNSSKVMVVLGTKPEHFNAVWVKNEWSRFLGMIKNGASDKVLIPAYRGMDPYDLPEEFSHLQAQDMSKLGFMQDLIRGIKKILGKNQQATNTTTTVVGGAESVEPLMKRAKMFLEDAEWDDAETYFNKALDINPELAEAYVGLLLIETNCRLIDALKYCNVDFGDYNNYQRALRFADKDLKAKLEKALADSRENIREQNEQKKIATLENGYTTATEAMQDGKKHSSLDFYKIAIDTFNLIGDYKDSLALKKQCEDAVAELVTENNYKKAVLLQEKYTVVEVQEAITIFQSIIDWKDSASRIDACNKKIEELHAVAAAQMRRKSRNRLIAVIVVFVLIVSGVATGVGIVMRQYENGLEYVLMKDYYVAHALHNENLQHIKIPATHLGIPVTVGRALCRKNEKIKTIEIAEGVESVEGEAFYGCYNVTDIKLPSTLKHVYSGAFNLEGGTKNSSKLQNLHISDLDAWVQIYFGQTNDNPLYFAKNLMLNGSLVTEVTISEGVTEIDSNAFCYYNALKKVKLPSTITEIGHEAFSHCTALEEIELANGLKKIGYDAFIGCKSLKSITIPDSVTSIGIRAFQDCLALTSVNIGNGVKRIDPLAFYNCKSLTNVTLGNSLNSIGYHAFENCVKLTSITIPGSVTRIEDRVFYGCSALTGVIFENTNGWWLGSKTATSGTTIPAAELKNSATAATYLTDTHCTEYWRRGENNAE